jgi:cytoskeletal protein CcmA (bactofilin family)
MKKTLVPIRKRHGGTIDCVIGTGVVVNGNLSCEGMIRIEGTCSGRLSSKMNLVVAEGARVDAKLSAQNIVIAGKVNGSIVAKNSVRLTSSARVRADIKTSQFSMDEGARLWGRVEIVQ